MALYEVILNLIKEKGLTIKQVERECGLSNATIRRWNTQNPSFDSVKKVAYFLNISLDALAEGNSEQATFCKEGNVLIEGSALDEEETNFISMYRLLKASSKETAFDFIEMMYEKEKGQKGSIYSTYIEDKSGSADSRKASGGTA